MSFKDQERKETLLFALKQLIDVVCLVLFIIALIGECYALYTKHYGVRYYTRTFLIPLAFVRIFNKDVFFSMHFFIYLSLLLSWFGDILNTIPDFKIQYLASTSYTLSYLVFGIVFYNFKDTKKMFVNYIFYSCFAVLGVVVFFVFYFPVLSDTLNLVHLVIHGIVLFFALIWAISIRKDIGNVGFKYFIPCILLMIFANGIYAVDYFYINTVGTVHFYTQRHTSIDVVVAILYGIYILLFTQGIRYLKVAQLLELKKEAEYDTYLNVD